MVTIARPLAVSNYQLTLADWDVCTDYGDCDPRINDSGFGRGQQPVINVNWNDAQQYVTWLSRVTGKTYRLQRADELIE
jgi:formylglycine-generating enzyme required for sulfatase activity